MELKLALCCDAAREREDGKLDLVGIFDELAAPGFPAVQERLTIVFVVEWSQHELGRQPLRADLVDDEDRRVLTIQGHAEVAEPQSGGRLVSRLVMPLENVVFPHPGPFHFDLLAGGEQRRACSLYLREAPAA